MSEDINDNTLSLLVIKAILQEYIKLYPCIYTVMLNTCETYINYEEHNIFVISDFIRTTLALLKEQYHADHSECLKINDLIKRLHTEYEYLDGACGPFLIYVFDTALVHTDLINNLIRLRQDLHERLLFIGYNIIRS